LRMKYIRDREGFFFDRPRGDDYPVLYCHKLESIMFPIIWDIHPK